MSFRRPLRLLCFAIFVASAALVLAASDPHPVVGPGATKDDVINAYGWPNGQSRLGTKEILSYAQGEVTLENGRVERVDFSPNVPWQTPRPRPAPATATTRRISERPVDYWLVHFDAALQEAQRRHCRILALFTGSDWSPASREFHETVEFNPDFVDTFSADFVFLKLDFPRGAPVPAKISAENLALRDRYHVTTYPSLLVLAPTGELLGRADLDRKVAGQSFSERVIDAVREVRDATPVPAGAPPPVGNAPTAVAAVASATPVATPSAGAESPADAVIGPASAAAGRAARTGGLSSATRMIVGALGVGGIVVALVLWLLWRRPREVQPADFSAISHRISAAASGLPSGDELNGWPQDKLCAVTAALAEFDGYAARIRPTIGDVDIELRKPGDIKPRVLVCCSPGSVGVVSVKRVRELFGSLAADAAEVGWFVSPAGFSPEARDYAAAHRIVLVGTDELQNIMRDVPPVSLPSVLARG